jgi:hypothetical protein
MARWALIAFLLCSISTPARAWTRAHVREADVELVLATEGSLEVSIDLTVEVTGGWLERLEIADLSGLPEDASEVVGWLKAEDGSMSSAEVRLEPEHLELRFSRGNGPRRGVHHLGARYRVPLPLGALPGHQGGEQARIEWTLPGWESGLTRASVHWLLPAGASAVSDPELAEQLTRSALPDGRARLSFERVHIPRASPWTVAIDMPSHSLGGSGVQPGSGGVRSGHSPNDLGTFACAAALVFALAWNARRDTRQRELRSGANAPATMLLGRFGLLAALGLTVLSVALLPVSLAAALAALCAVGIGCTNFRASAPMPVELGHFEPIAPAALTDLRRAYFREWLGRGPWVDLGSLLGGLGGLACLVSAWVGAGGLEELMAGDVLPADPRPVPWALALACALVPLLSSARFRLPRSLAAQVRLLRREASKLRCEGVAMRLLWFTARPGVFAQPRLRLALAQPHQGLLRMDLMVDSRPSAAPLSLCVVMLAGSSAAQALGDHWSGATRCTSASGRRLALSKTVSDLEGELERVLCLLSAHQQGALEGWLQPAGAPSDASRQDDAAA